MSVGYYEYDDGEVGRLRDRIAELEAAHDQAMKGWDIAQKKEIDAIARAEAAESRIAELEAALELNAAFGVALNYFLLRDPDKPTSWMYSRNKAEELARTALGEKETKQ